MILACLILKDKNTRVSKGIAFIDLESHECAERAMTELNGKQLRGEGTPLQVKAYVA